MQKFCIRIFWLDCNQIILVYNPKITLRLVYGICSRRMQTADSPATRTSTRRIGCRLILPATSRMDQPSLHDDILSRLRDYIVEGNIPDGARVPERQLCEMLRHLPHTAARSPQGSGLGRADRAPAQPRRSRPAVQRGGSRQPVRRHGRARMPRRTPRLRAHHGRGNRRDRAPALGNVWSLPAPRHARLFPPQPADPPEHRRSRRATRRC